MGAILKKIKVVNIGCIGSEGVEIELDNIVCLTGLNNVGKSTILDAYVYAYEDNLPDGKYCQWASSNDEAIVELMFEVLGESKIASKWINQNNIAHFKYTWKRSDKSDKKATRCGYNTQTDQFEENPGGPNNVFKSYLPKPIRVKSLDIQDPKQLVTLVSSLLPLSDDSTIQEAYNQFSGILKNSLEEFVSSEQLSKGLEAVNKDVKQVLSSDLQISLSVNPPDLGELKLNEILSKSASLTFKTAEGTEVNYEDQGTGTQRAVFWGMIQQFESSKAKGKASSTSKNKNSSEEDIPSCSDKRFILLIDEPENALHPEAIKKACELMYNFSEDPNRQVILTTHSPYFIDPHKDHTTIVRLEKKQDEQRITNRTFRSEKANFTEDEKANLKYLLAMDTSLCEVFFGGYPIIVEGATEYVAFNYIFNNFKDDIESILRERDLTHFKLIRAEGKYTIIPVAKILGQFKVPFSTLHDLDTPITTKGKGNSAWMANSQIWQALKTIKDDNPNITIGHIVSKYNFEMEHSGELASKEKPWKMKQHLEQSKDAQKSVKDVLVRLLQGESDFEKIQTIEDLETVLNTMCESPCAIPSV